MRAHPVAELFPMMTDVELDDLAADIKEKGLQQPIVVHDGLILDGRNRVAACLRAEVAARQVEWDGAGGSPLQFVISANLHRRHLSTSQRAAVAAEIREHFLSEVEERRKTAIREAAKLQPRIVSTDGRGERFASTQDRAENSPVLAEASDEAPSNHSRSSYQAGMLMGVGHDSVTKASRVKREDPVLFQRIKQGEITVNTADHQVRAGTSEPRRQSRAGRLLELLEPLNRFEKSWDDGSLYRVGSREADTLDRHIQKTIAFLERVSGELVPLRSRTHVVK